MGLEGGNGTNMKRAEYYAATNGPGADDKNCRATFRRREGNCCQQAQPDLDGQWSNLCNSEQSQFPEATTRSETA